MTEHSPPSCVGVGGGGILGKEIGPPEQDPQVRAALVGAQHGQIFLETQSLNPRCCCSVCVRWKRLLHLRVGLEVAVSLL